MHPQLKLQNHESRVLVSLKHIIYSNIEGQMRQGCGQKTVNTTHNPIATRVYSEYTMKQTVSIEANSMSNRSRHDGT